MSEDDRPPAAFASGGLSWTRVRTPRILSRLAKACVVIGALTSMIAGNDSALFALVSALTTFFAMWLFIASYILSLTQNGSAGSLEANHDGLVIQSRQKRIALPHAQIRSAMIVERRVFEEALPTVEVELVNGDLLVARLPEPGAAVRIAKALGFGTGGARVHARLGLASRRLWNPLLGAVTSLLALAMIGAVSELLRSVVGEHPERDTMLMAAYPLVALGLYAVWKHMIRAPEVTIGDDGVLVRGRFRTRFVPRHDIGLVSAAAGTPMFIETRSGERIRVNGLLLDQGRLAAIAQLIDERAGPSVAAADRFAHYARRGRPLPEWRAHLARSMNDASYRMNPATVDEAAAVLRSAQATPEERVGAAIALRVAGEPKARVLVAAEASVDDRVREALEAVVESDDDAPLEKALRRLV